MSTERPPGRSGNSRGATSRLVSWVLGITLLLLLIALVARLITNG